MPTPFPAVRFTRLLAILTAFATYALLVLGSTVRVTKSGMGCPGWPLCYGQIGPTHGFHAVMEQSHRYLAGLVTILVLATLIGVIKARPALSRSLRPAIASAAVVAIQVVLGAVTVVAHNAPPTVAAHLITGLILAGAVTLTAVTTYSPWPDRTQRSLGRDAGDSPPPAQLSRTRSMSLLAALVATGLVMVSGSVVLDGNAARSCPAWPLCGLHSGWTRFVVIQTVHRGTVLLATVAIAALVVQTLAGNAHSRPARIISIGLSVLLASQIVIGAFTALLKAPETLQDLHLSFAAAIWMSLVALASVDWYHTPPGSPSSSGSVDESDLGLSALVEIFPCTRG